MERAVEEVAEAGTLTAFKIHWDRYMDRLALTLGQKACFHIV